MLDLRITIERTAEGRICLAYDGQRREVATLREVLRYIEAIFASSRRPLTQATPKPETPAQEDQDWIRTLCGKYRDVLTPTEQYLREKQEEIELEERKLARQRS